MGQGETMSLNQKMSLNEMAQINLNEQGFEKNGCFDASRYYVYVRGEGGNNKFPHFHIKHLGEGWDIRMNIPDGTLHSIKDKSSRRQNPEDFIDIEKISILWAKSPNVFEPDKTNGRVAEIEWYRNNG